MTIEDRLEMIQSRVNKLATKEDLDELSNNIRKILIGMGVLSAITLIVLATMAIIIC